MIFADYLNIYTLRPSLKLHVTAAPDLETKKGTTQIFSAIQVTPSLSPAHWSENRKTSLQGLILLNNLGDTNMREFHCQDFLWASLPIIIKIGQ